ncbi:hypothetical protein EOD39_5896 [Acipenser ruthenus]|uniref:Uncharacterized protein n=1 Tax=Acipenser ruthenus TaxID=7906 RepID=A0A444UCF3_ACIRT|nr:hypothetical protein EOD39_5896 [Acipenser ruthenus]
MNSEELGSLQRGLAVGCGVRGPVLLSPAGEMRFRAVSSRLQENHKTGAGYFGINSDPEQICFPMRAERVCGSSKVFGAGLIENPEADPI